MTKTIIGVIPARGGSKGVPRKNIRNICGKPLIQYIFESAKKSRYITKLILSTEDEEIANIGKSFGIEIPFMRPKEFATDNATGISVIKHALSFFDKASLKADAVISLQPTNPFTSTETIDKAIELWLETDCDSITSITEITDGHPYITKKLLEENIIENFCAIPEGLKMHRRQHRETAYYLTGALYLRTRNLINAKDMDSHYLGKDSRAVVVNKIESIDIDTPFDIEFVEWIMSKKKDQI